MPKFNSRPENVAAVERLAGLLAQVPIASVIHYEDLNAAAGKDVQKSGRHLLVSAIERVEDDTGWRFGTVTGKGIKRLADNEMVSIGSDHIKRTRRAAERGVKKLTGLSANLSERDGSMIVGYRTILSVAASITKPDNAKRAADEARKAPGGAHDKVLNIEIK